MSTLKGIDISKWQGDVDFKQIKFDGVQFCILREGYRKDIDQKFREYVKGCKEANIEIPAVYHFMYSLNVEDAKTEAYSAVSNVRFVGLDEKTIIFADFEYDTITNAQKKGITLTKADCIAHTAVFCEEVIRLGFTPGIYTNLDFYKNWYDKSLLNKHIIWLADYTGGPDFKCTFQQYTSKGSVDGIKGYVDMNYWYKEEKQQKEVGKMYSRQKMVNLVMSWLGKNEADGSYKTIIDTYNSFTGKFPRGTKMQYGWAWCACTWSAAAIKLGYTQIIPIEISCYYLIEAAKKMNCWQENDGYIPQPGDAVLYDWQDSGIGDNTGSPDHVGTVVEVNSDAGYFVVVEGNYSNSVKKRTMSINGKFIRGFIVPKYTDNVVTNTTQSGNKSIDVIAKEVIAGTWGSGEYRKQQLQKAGYDYAKVQAKVNEILNGGAHVTTNENQSQKQPTEKKVTATAKATSYDKSLAGNYTTTANLYCRNDAGTNKKALVLIPKGTVVKNYGYYSIANGMKWLYIQVAIDGVLYTGFSSQAYLLRR